MLGSHKYRREDMAAGQVLPENNTINYISYIQFRLARGTRSEILPTLSCVRLRFVGFPILIFHWLKL